ncbi:MAG: molybdopterin-dependent oxidoreductase, partial [Acidimicrobiales bacterium]
APRGQSYGSGPTDFQVNRTAAVAGISRSASDPAWQLELVGAGGRTRHMTRAALLALPQVGATLPIACVEGWSTVQHWSGVRLLDLASLVGAAGPTGAYVASLEGQSWPFSHASLSTQQVRAGQAMLALRVNGVDLSLDHGYPARVILPDAPGVHNTKWVARITFTGGA